MNPVEVRRLATAGFARLLPCSALSFGIQAVGLGVLAALLSPASLGAYGVAVFVVGCFALLGDAGLGPALVRQTDEPSAMTLHAAFAVQLALSAVVALALVLGAPALASVYGIGSDGASLIRVMGVLVLAGPFRSIPALLLERRLRLEILARVELVDTLVFHATAVGAAWLGADVWSFALAAVARAGADLVQLFLLRAWRPALTFELRPLARLVRFGASVRLVTLLCFAKDHAGTALAGLVYGPAAVGYLNWALWFSALPLLVVNQLSRVTFPAFSRLSDSPREVASALQSTIRLSMLAGCGASGVLAASAPWVVTLAYDVTWQPTIALVVLLTPNMIAGYLTGTLMNLLWALDRAALALKLSAFWAGATWAVALGLIGPMGVMGVALAYSAASVVVAAVLARIVETTLAIPVRPAVRGPILGSGGMAAAAAIYAVSGLAGNDLLLPIVVGLAYVLVVVAVDRNIIGSDCRVVVRFIRLSAGYTA